MDQPDEDASERGVDGAPRLMPGEIVPVTVRVESFVAGEGRSTVRIKRYPDGWWVSSAAAERGDPAKLVEVADDTEPKEALAAAVELVGLLRKREHVLHQVRPIDDALHAWSVA